ncbi:hypothetical protein BS50DRAFT_653777 [Corynespora cassiicola Philippines]|uniref:(4-O-methyl)-D-glucuronate--lignin esterase n=1 Tax=Corynespora cassiicola Philippines TaxID=1448308 RepID=A0A2T2P6J8_CORCC|nr:hypothetical protein BS50DRAFT_653777 [Corynespora cassiicola Philippines]
MLLLATCVGTLLLGIARAACPDYSTNITLSNNPSLPDPFRYASGGHVATKADWTCRRAQLVSLLQEHEFGWLPRRPFMVATYLVDKVLTIAMAENSKRVSFNVTITLPSNKTVADGPFPALITYHIPTVPLAGNIATITYASEEIASLSHGSRARGKFYDMYGSDHSAGSLTAHAWGISRIIDALVAFNSSITGIDTKRIGVMGCSQYGKSALIAGAFDERIALTITQDAGVGGPACWRLGGDKHRYSFGPNFGGSFTRLPFDHHELLALHAPRGLLVLEKDLPYLQPVASTVCANAGREVFKALGVQENIGFSMLHEGHSMCRLLEEDQDAVEAFMRKFLLEASNETQIWRSTKDNTTDRWNWTTPVLN